MTMPLNQFVKSAKIMGMGERSTARRAVIGRLLGAVHRETGRGYPRNIFAVRPAVRLNESLLFGDVLTYVLVTDSETPDEYSKFRASLVERCAALLEWDDEPPELIARDLLADLRHYCLVNDLGFDDLVEDSRQAFAAERKE